MLKVPNEVAGRSLSFFRLVLRQHERIHSLMKSFRMVLDCILPSVAAPSDSQIA